MWRQAYTHPAACAGFPSTLYIYSPGPSAAGGDPPIGAPFDLILLLGLAAGLLAIPFLRRPRRWILLWCAAFLARCLWDAATWQPYFLKYWFFLLALGLVPWQGRDTDQRRVEEALDPLRLAMIAIYMYSGLAKLHHEFLVDAGPAMLEPLTGRLGPSPGEQGGREVDRPPPGQRGVDGAADNALPQGAWAETMPEAPPWLQMTWGVRRAT